MLGVAKRPNRERIAKKGANLSFFALFCAEWRGQTRLAHLHLVFCNSLQQLPQHNTQNAQPWRPIVIVRRLLRPPGRNRYSLAIVGEARPSRMLGSGRCCAERRWSRSISAAGEVRRAPVLSSTLFSPVIIFTSRYS